MAFEKEAKIKWEKKGVTFSKLSEEDAKFARESAQSARQDFIEKQESDGHPARATWEFFSKQRQKYDDELKAKGYPWER